MQIGKNIKARRRGQQHLGVRSQAQIAVILVAPEQTVRGAVGDEGGSIKTGGSGDFVFAAQDQRLAGIDAAFVIVRVEWLDTLWPQSDFVVAACAAAR